MNNSCEFECEGDEECNCDSFQLTTPEKNRSKFLYIGSVGLLILTALILTLMSIFDSVLIDFTLVILGAGAFLVIFVIAVNIPLKYHRICVSHKVYYKDIGVPRIQRKYVFVIDVLIAAVPLMIFIWDITHTIIYVANGTTLSDDIPFCYVIDEFWIWDEWNLIAQGWLDFGLASVGIFLFIVEVWVWFDKRDANLCTARFDDIPVLSVDEIEERVKKTDGHYLEENLLLNPDDEFAEELLDLEWKRSRDFEGEYGK